MSVSIADSAGDIIEVCLFDYSIYPPLDLTPTLSEYDAAFPIDRFIEIKEPNVRMSYDGAGEQIKVHCPTDIRVLCPMDADEWSRTYDVKGWRMVGGVGMWRTPQDTPIGMGYQPYCKTVRKVSGLFRGARSPVRVQQCQTEYSSYRSSNKSVSSPRSNCAARAYVNSLKRVLCGFGKRWRKYMWSCSSSAPACMLEDEHLRWQERGSSTIAPQFTATGSLAGPGSI